MPAAASYSGICLHEWLLIHALSAVQEVACMRGHVCLVAGCSSCMHVGRAWLSATEGGAYRVPARSLIQNTCLLAAGLPAVLL
jgi:hypothetical protein